MSLFRIFSSSSSTEREDEKTTEVVREPDARLSRPASSEVRETPRFDATVVLEAAGVSTEQRERVERALELLRALPAETPATIRKNIVEASLKAFDISIKGIVEAATAEVAAFNAYIAAGQKQLDDLSRQSHERIAALEAEIAKVKQRLELAAADQAALDRSTSAASDRVKPVLSFFSEVPPPRVASNTLNEYPPSIIIDESLTRVG